VEVSGQVHAPVALCTAPFGWEARTSADSLENRKVFVTDGIRTMMPQLSNMESSAQLYYAIPASNRTLGRVNWKYRSWLDISRTVRHRKM